MIDANQRWDVDEAIERVKALSRFDLLVDRRADEPGRRARARARSRGRCAPVGVATGEHCANRVIFKQLLQAQRDQLLPDRQLPARRRQREPRRHPDGREVRRPGVPARRRRRAVRAACSTCRCSTSSRVSGRMDDRVTEFVDHLHEHFVDPVVIRRGRYMRADRARVQQRRSSPSRGRPIAIPTGRFGGQPLVERRSRSTALKLSARSAGRDLNVPAKELTADSCAMELLNLVPQRRPR